MDSDIEESTLANIIDSRGAGNKLGLLGFTVKSLKPTIPRSKVQFSFREKVEAPDHTTVLEELLRPISCT
jgi:hypothetical protein